MFRMAASPFGFFPGRGPGDGRGSGTPPHDRAPHPDCGDAHVKNLGAYAAPDGHLVFDLNDFDETIVGPWEWDLKRLATSLVLAGREARAGRTAARDAVVALVRSYRETLDTLARLCTLDLLRVEVRRHLGTGLVHEVLLRAARLTPEHILEKLTIRGRGGALRFHDRRPVLEHVPMHVSRAVIASLAAYRDTLGPDRQIAFDAYRPVDVAFKVVGTGSVGTRDFVVLLTGRGPQDALFLQVKEALASCYARYLPRAPAYAHQGRRVAEGQHRMQTATDPLLGWTRFAGRDYLVRQLADHKAALDPAKLVADALLTYALVSGETLAKAHARTGDANAIAGYCGQGDKLGRALARFAAAYADQTEQDHARLVRAIKAGEVEAASEFKLRRDWHGISSRAILPSASPSPGDGDGDGGSRATVTSPNRPALV